MLSQFLSKMSIPIKGRLFVVITSVVVATIIAISSLYNDLRVAEGDFSEDARFVKKFFEQRITFLPPTVTSTFGESVGDFILLRIGQSEQVLLIKVGFSIADTDVSGSFTLLFTVNSLAPLLTRIRNKTTQTKQ